MSDGAERSGGADWTTGVAKWAAVAVLGGASMFGIAWSMGGRQIRRVEAAPAAVVERMVPGDQARPSDPSAGVAGGVIGNERASEPVVPASEPSSLPAPVTDTASPTSPLPSDSAALARRININTAAAAELELLPGIGPALAARIIDDRRTHGAYRSVDDLDRVKGIGPRTIDKLRALATVE